MASFLGRLRPSSRLTKVRVWPGQTAIPKNYSTDTKIIDESSLDALLGTVDPKTGTDLRKTYLQDTQQSNFFWEDPQVELVRKSLREHQFWKQQAQEPTKYEKDGLDFALQDVILLRAEAKMLGTLIEKLPKEDTKTIALEKDKMKSLLDYSADLTSMLEKRGLSKEVIEKATPKPATAKYIAALEKRVNEGDYLGWLCLLLACARGWNETVRYWLGRPGTHANSFTANYFLWPSTNDQFKYIEAIDDGVDGVVLVKRKSPLYKLITDNYGDSVFYNPKTDTVESLTTANLEDYLGESAGSAGRKILIQILVQLSTVPDANKSAIEQKVIKDVTEGFSLEIDFVEQFVGKT